MEKWKIYKVFDKAIRGGIWSAFTWEDVVMTIPKIKENFFDEIFTGDEENWLERFTGEEGKYIHIPHLVDGLSAKTDLNIGPSDLVRMNSAIFSRHNKAYALLDSLAPIDGEFFITAYKTNLFGQFKGTILTNKRVIKAGWGGIFEIKIEDLKTYSVFDLDFVKFYFINGKYFRCGIGIYKIAEALINSRVKEIEAAACLGWGRMTGITFKGKSSKNGEVELLKGAILLLRIKRK